MVRNPAGVRYPTAEARVFENATTPVRKLPLVSGVGLLMCFHTPCRRLETNVRLPRPGEQSPTAQSCFVPGIGTTAASVFVTGHPSGTLTAFQPADVWRSTSACAEPDPRPPTAQSVFPENTPSLKNDSPPRAGSGALETCHPKPVR